MNMKNKEKHAHAVFFFILASPVYFLRKRFWTPLACLRSSTPALCLRARSLR